MANNYTKFKDFEEYYADRNNRQARLDSKLGFDRASVTQDSLNEVSNTMNNFKKPASYKPLGEVIPSPSVQSIDTNKENLKKNNNVIPTAPTTYKNPLTGKVQPLNSGSSYTQKPIYNDGKLSEVDYEAKENSIGGKAAMFLKDNPVTQNIIKPALYGTMQSYANSIATPLAKLGNQEESINKINKINAQVDNSKNKNIISKASGFVGNSVADMSLYSPIAKLTGIGKLAGGVGDKVASNLGGGALGGIVGAGAREGLENAGLSAITGLGGLTSGYDSLGQYVGNVAMEGLSGAAFGGALDGIGRGTNFVKNKLDTAFDPIDDLLNIRTTENVTPQTTLKKNQVRDIKPKLEAKAEAETDAPVIEKGLDDNIIKDTPQVKNIKSNIELVKGKTVNTPLGEGKIVSSGMETVVVDINGTKEIFPKDSISDVKATEIPKLPDLPNIDVKKELDNLDLKFTERDFYRDMADMRYKKDSIMGQDEGLDDYIKEYAGMIKEDLRFGTKGGDVSVNKETGKPIQESSVQSEAFKIIQAQTGASYGKITESLDRIMNGQITNTLDRKIETVIDDVLINGTRLSDGLPIPPNEGYISRKAEYETLVKDKDKFLRGENKQPNTPLESVSMKESNNTPKSVNNVIEADNGVKTKVSENEINKNIGNETPKTQLNIKVDDLSLENIDNAGIDVVKKWIKKNGLYVKGKDETTLRNAVKEVFQKRESKGRAFRDYLVDNEYNGRKETDFYKPKTEATGDEIAASYYKENEKLSRNANITAQEKSILSDETKKRIRGTTYEATTEKENLDWGIKEIEFRGIDESVTRYMEGNYTDKEATMVGAILREELDAQGRYKEADKVARKLSEDLSTAGQTIQAVAQFNKQTPSGMLDTARKTVKDLQDKVLDKPAKKTAFDDLNKKLGNGEITQEQFYKELDKAKIPYLTDAQQKEIFDMQTRVKSLEKEIQTVTDLLNETNVKDTKQIDDLRNVINYLVSEQDKTIAKREKVAKQNIHKSNFEKFQNYRYMSMLFNTKTLLARNPLASLVRLATDSIGNPLGVAIDKSLSKKTNIRTRYKNDYTGTGKTIGKSFSNMKYDFENGTNISNNNPNNIDFKEGSKGLIGKSFQYAMNLGDVPFADIVNNAQVRGYMKEKGLTDISQVPKEILELAFNKGRENNFQNKNILTPWINKGKKLPVVGQVLDATMPFVNTSMNIVQDGYERSPLGLAHGLVDLARVNSKNTPKSDLARLQKSAVDKITKGTVGLGTTALGYAMGDSFTNGYDKDSKVAEAEKTAGKRANSLEIGDYDFDLSQLSTLAPNLQLGSYLKKNGLNLSNLAKGTTKQLSNSLESSPFGGLQKVFEDLSNDQIPEDERVMYAGANLVGNYANQFIPTQLKYLNNSIDDTRRDTYSDNPVKRQINTIQSNIPMLSMMLPAQVDILGNEKKKYPNMNGLEAAINSNLNPLLTSKSGGVNQRQLDNIVKVGKETGSGSHIPQLYSKKILGNNLTKEQLNDYKKYYGEYSRSAKTEAEFKDALERAEQRIISKYNLKNLNKK